MPSITPIPRARMKLPMMELAWKAVNKRHQPVGHIEGRHADKRDRVLGRDANALNVLTFNVVFLEHGINPFAGSRNQNNFDASGSEHGQVFEQLREVGSVQDRIIDLQYDGFTGKPVLVIKHLPDQVDLLPVLDLIHVHTLAEFEKSPRRCEHIESDDSNM